MLLARLHERERAVVLQEPQPVQGELLLARVEDLLVGRAIAGPEDVVALLRLEALAVGVREQQPAQQQRALRGGRREPQSLGRDRGAVQPEVRGLHRKLRDARLLQHGILRLDRRDLRLVGAQELDRLRERTAAAQHRELLRRAGEALERSARDRRERVLVVGPEPQHALVETHRALVLPRVRERLRRGFELLDEVLLRLGPLLVELLLRLAVALLVDLDHRLVRVALPRVADLDEAERRQRALVARRPFLQHEPADLGRAAVLLVLRERVGPLQQRGGDVLLELVRDRARIRLRGERRRSGAPRCEDGSDDDAGTHAQPPTVNGNDSASPFTVHFTVASPFGSGANG